jgi:hypothetical protein
MNIQPLKFFAVSAVLSFFSAFVFAAETAETVAALANLSARTAVGTGDNVGITGFIVRSDEGDTKRIVLRGVGPSIQSNGVPVPGRLVDPVLELHDNNGGVIAFNDNWMSAPNAAEIQAAGLAPSDPREAAILTDLPANANYTAVISGKNNSTGIGLIEMYDLNLPSAVRADWPYRTHRPYRTDRSDWRNRPAGSNGQHRRDGPHRPARSNRDARYSGFHWFNRRHRCNRAYRSDW